MLQPETVRSRLRIGVVRRVRWAYTSVMPPSDPALPVIAASVILLTLSACTAPGEPERIRPPGQGGDADTDSDADADGDADTDGDTDVDTGDGGPREMRGIWVTRWSFQSPDEVGTIIDEVKNAGFNAVFIQVRGNFDALYDSPIEPWSRELSGTLGQDPGWDPLDEAVRRGHDAGLQVHAYLNTFPFWSGTSPPPDTSPEHAYNAHPDWLVADGSGTPMALNSSYVFASPGNAEVRARVAAVAHDIASRYAVDGIHLDYIRYPGPDYSHDAASEAAFAGSSEGLSWADWERRQVVETLRGVYDASGIPVTAAVWGIYENAWGWSSVTEGNIDYYQDSRAFLAEGVTDAIVPMIYWEVAGTHGDRLDFATLIEDHVDHAAGRHVYAGIDSSLGPTAVFACIDAARAAGAQGVVLFDWSTASGAGWLSELATGRFATPALPPGMPWRE
jgi:uncharacterized lipoprotein YddW (UPF0748 family)